MSETTILWHDYETWGVNPRKDRAAQFAAIRTSIDLEVIGEPVCLYCRPGTDCLPWPEAVMLHGITPQRAQLKGLNEAEFFAGINQEFMVPGTCVTGYNSLRFDDEVTRFGFYRNFIDPYAREWQNGNSRWDILDLLRMTYALRPDGINWPVNQDGTCSFKLEHLTAANNIPHTRSHDALADVRATIDLARLVRQLQPRLFDFLFNLRRKQEAGQLLNLSHREMILHVSGMFPAATGCIAPMVPLVVNPLNKNEIIACNLRQDPAALLAMTAEEMRENLFTAKEDLPENVERIGLKGIHLNKCPALAPVSTLNPELADKWQINLQQAEQYRVRVLADPDLSRRIMELYQNRPAFAEEDPDTALYSQFISSSDRRICNDLLNKTPEQLAAWIPCFEDNRLQELYFRYRARNWPESLSELELQQWQSFCEARLMTGEYGNSLTVQRYMEQLEELRLAGISEEKQELYKELVQWMQ
jgi:exodeoxyribonuclease-1